MLDGNQEGEDSPTYAITMAAAENGEEQKQGFGDVIAEKVQLAQSTIANNPGYKLLKTKIGIEISSLEETNPHAHLNRTKTSNIMDNRNQLTAERIINEMAPAEIQEVASGTSSDGKKPPARLQDKAKTEALKDRATSSYLEPKSSQLSKKKGIAANNRSINSDLSRGSSDSNNSG